MRGTWNSNERDRSQGMPDARKHNHSLRRSSHEFGAGSDELSPVAHPAQRRRRWPSSYVGNRSRPIGLSLPMIAVLSSLLVAAAPQAAPSTPSVPSPPEPDISLSISAHVDQVRWRQVGSVSVRAWAEPSGSVIEENLSTGLPRPIPGQRTFRNVQWNLNAAATIAVPDETATPAAPDPRPGDAQVPDQPQGDPR